MPASIECAGAPTGLTLTASTFPDGSDTASDTGLACTEATNRKGVYTFSTTRTGLQLIQLKSGSNVVWFGWAVLAASGTIQASDERTSALNSLASIADAVWDEALSGHTTAGTTGEALNDLGSAADPLENEVPGSYASGTAGHALGRIGSAQVTTTSPVAQNGKVEVVQGCDYDAADGLSLDWTDASNTWPVLTDATIAVNIDDGELILAGSVVTATGSSKKVRAEPTAAETAALEPGHYRYVVMATLASGNKVALAAGLWTVVDGEAS
jgi:hypothetical protein